MKINYILRINKMKLANSNYILKIENLEMNFQIKYIETYS